MLVKEGVSLQRLDIHMRPVLKAADLIWKARSQECVITSGDEVADENGKLHHSTGSLHYYGRAVDLRTRYFTKEEALEVFDELKAELSKTEYDVIWHSSHIHVEYDPKW